MSTLLVPRAVVKVVIPLHRGKVTLQDRQQGSMRQEGWHVGDHKASHLGLGMLIAGQVWMHSFIPKNVHVCCTCVGAAPPLTHHREAAYQLNQRHLFCTGTASHRRGVLCMCSIQGACHVAARTCTACPANIFVLLLRVMPEVTAILQSV